MKYIYTLALFLFSVIIHAQMGTIQELGLASLKELEMTFYEKDSSAKALVLEEKGHVYIDQKNDYNFRRDVYRRVKIFDTSEVERANISINTYKKEKVINIKAISYTSTDGLIKKIFLSDQRIYKKQLSENWNQTSFTLPNVKAGSIIEYTYSVISPYNKLDDWVFQSDIPKIKSDFKATILGNWNYNIRLRLYKPLDRKNNHIEKECVVLSNGITGDCNVTEFGLDHIPAFKGEDYMLSEENFKSKVIFEPVSYTNVHGRVTKFTKTWKDADKTLKNNLFDGQTSKKNYFKRNLPEEVLANKDNLGRAKAVYQHIQKELNWNGKLWSSDKIKVKDIYQDKIGSVDAINLSLYNALQAAKIESYLVVLSTRENGKVTKLFPSVTEFNYVLVKVIINDESYFLDATDKNLLFGEIPFRCLNGDGRVLDFSKGSYWELIKPKFNSYISHSISLNFEEDELKGEIKTSRKGYYAQRERKRVNSKSEDEYLDEFESKNPFIEVDSLNNIAAKDGEGTFKTVLKINIPEIAQENTIRLNPFFTDRTKENPFKLNERNYPVNFGFTFSKSHQVNIKIPDGYSINKLPENKIISLPNNGGRFIFNAKKTENSVKIFSKFFLRRAVFNQQEYHYLKEFYNQIINAQNQEIVLIKN
ncbi:DUF3857 domain-containing protein [Tenacibaculum jejuense]|uniref:Uncharacterized protein n=1 Tax=Tenacibaculum jejuense TaxID=584609 RepID=A0A238U7R2_9FLAO|nr:DUF3857 domain-containing protein [Tenacibaculum jejuense]SNR14638.1 conserved protein of unknown function [Tenacibaculum jejuense]